MYYLDLFSCGLVGCSRRCLRLLWSCVGLSCVFSRRVVLCFYHTSLSCCDLLLGSLTFSLVFSCCFIYLVLMYCPVFSWYVLLLSSLVSLIVFSCRLLLKILLSLFIGVLSYFFSCCLQLFLSRVVSSGSFILLCSRVVSICVFLLLLYLVGFPCCFLLLLYGVVLCCFSCCFSRVVLSCCGLGLCLFE